MKGEEPNIRKGRPKVRHWHRAVTWTLVAAFAGAALHAILWCNVVSPTTLTIVVVIAVPLMVFAVAEPRGRS